jgi:hypothetical protein
MAQTNSAFASGGMHHCSLRCGFSSFFQSQPDRLVGDRVDDLQLDKLVGQQLHGPHRPPLRRWRAGQGDEPGLGPAVELDLPGRSLPPLAIQGGVEAQFDESLTDPFDGVGADLQGVGDLPVRPGGSAVGGVGLEQDAGMGQLAGGGLTGGDQVVEVLAFLGFPSRTLICSVRLSGSAQPSGRHGVVWKGEGGRPPPIQRNTRAKRVGMTCCGHPDSHGP